MYLWDLEINMHVFTHSFTVYLGQGYCSFGRTGICHVDQAGLKLQSSSFNFNTEITALYHHHVSSGMGQSIRDVSGMESRVYPGVLMEGEHSFLAKDSDPLEHKSQLRIQ